jgi:membrane protease YdiL (CAAX protease family)
MTSPTEPRTPQLYQALAITGLGIATIYGFQLVLSSLGVLEIVASAVADVVTVAALLWLARTRRVDLGLRMPPARFLVAGLLVGLSAWYIALEIVLWVQPPGDERLLQRVVEQGSLAPALLGLALLPALAEELVFRGALARGLATRWPRWAAIVVSAAVFAVYHLIPSQMLGVLPLGLALGLLAVQSGSVVPGMIAHLTNNAIALVLSRDELPSVSRAVTARPEMALVAAIVALGCATLLCAKGAA